MDKKVTEPVTSLSEAAAAQIEERSRQRMRRNLGRLPFPHQRGAEDVDALACVDVDALARIAFFSFDLRNVSFLYYYRRN